MPLPLVPIAAGAAALAYLDAKYYIAEDLNKAGGLIQVKRALATNDKKDRNSIYYQFEDMANKQKDAEYLACENVSITWSQAQRKVNRLAHWLLSRGLKRGDTLALYMPNKPAYPLIWLACLAIDVVPAFINYNLTDDGLRHCVLVAKASMVLYESDLAANIADVADALRQSKSDMQFVSWADNFSKAQEKSADAVQGSVQLTPEALKAFSAERVPDERREGISWQDPACLIYTSGTTGLPKAAIVTHGRSATAFIVYGRINRFNTSTRIYTPMPLYHSTAALLAIGVGWRTGATVIIGRKFSASTYWKDVREHDANVIQYVGEVLRYLLAVPPSPLDKQHKVKQAYGNGCRPDVWEKFRERFGVQTISEFFASSEGNGSLFNYNSNKLGAGAVGHEGALATFARKTKQTIVKVDELTEEPARGPDGFCTRAAPNENGELVCLIDMTSPFEAFAGYYGNEAGTNKKILRDVFVKGDAYFRTGDLLRKTPEGYYYFADRLGDTFRWKSENVSTNQVAEALGAVLSEANVYGVTVPGHEGRAGCAAVPVDSARAIDWAQLSAHVQKALPKYAQPLFIRVVDSLEATGTGKHQKVKLRNEGVDPATVKDPVWWLNGGKYTRFTQQDWESLKDGKVKL